MNEAAPLPFTIADPALDGLRAKAPADPRHRGIPLQRFAPKGFRHEVEQARRYPKPPVAELLSHAPDLDGLEWAFRLALEGSEHASRGTKRKWTERALRKAWALAGTEEALYRIVRIAGEAGVDVGPPWRLVLPHLRRSLGGATDDAAGRQASARRACREASARGPGVAALRLPHEAVPLRDQWSLQGPRGVRRLRQRAERRPPIGG